MPRGPRLGTPGVLHPVIAPGNRAKDNFRNDHHRDDLVERLAGFLVRDDKLEFLEEGAMKGVQFVIDEQGQKTAVVIDLKRHAALWEDFYDAALAKSRQEEPRETFESVKRRLRRQGKLSPDA